jgi:hypothetical protein
MDHPYSPPQKDGEGRLHLIREKSRIIRLGYIILTTGIVLGLTAVFAQLYWLAGICVFTGYICARAMMFWTGW